MVKLFPALTAFALAAPIAIVYSAVTPAFAASIGGLTQTTSNTSYTGLANSVSANFLDNSTGGVDFSITNTGPSIFSITDIYFGRLTEFASALTFDSITNATGVKYSQGANPSNPGGGIKWDAAFAADPDAPSGFNKNGIDTGETLKVSFKYNPGYAFQNLVDGFANKSLTFAMHVQSVGGSGGGSEWIASDSSITSVPEPITVLGTLAAAGIGAGLRRKSNKVKSEATDA